MSAYSRFLENLAIPSYYWAKRRSYPSYRRLLEQSQWWTPEQIAAFQWRELQRLLEHAYRTVPYYRKKYAAAGIELGDIRTRDDFHKLPPLTREELNEHRAELCSADPKGRLIPHATGGSSGVPSRFFITPDSYDWRCAAAARAYSWSECRTGDRTLYLWGAPVGNVPLSKAAKLEAYRFLRREQMVPTFSQSPDLWRQTLRTAARFRPCFVVGYVSSLHQFAKFLLDEHASLGGVRAVIAAAEPLHESTRSLISQAFGAPVFNTYGSREFMSIAGECDRHDGLHVNSENLLLETELPPDQGSSELLVTDLHNYGMPFIRYRIGDLGRIGETVCSCGRGLPLLSGIEGRVLEVLRTKDGRIVPGEFFPHLLKDVPEVREFQVRQTTLDSIVISVVLSAPLSEVSRTLLRHETEKIFGSDVQVEIKPVDAIPRRPSGKRTVTVGLGSSV